MQVDLAVADCGTCSDVMADLVLTNPYGPLPPQLRGVPAIVSNFAERKDRCEAWIGRPLTEIGTWGRGGRNRVWVAGLPAAPLALDDLVEDEREPGFGWFPLELPLRLLRAYAAPGWTVFDGFMGRGTVGRACRLLGLGFIGRDIDPARVALAREYIGC